MKHNFSGAIFTLFFWLVPHVTVEIGAFYRSLSHSEHWQDPTKRKVGTDAILRSSLWAIGVSLLCIFVTATIISGLTRALDYNMVRIIEGGSNCMAAAVSLGISVKTPKWLGMYYSTKGCKDLPVGNSIRSLSILVRCGIYRQFLMIYFCLLPWYCGTGPLDMALSITGGILCGLGLDSFIHFGRRLKRLQTPWFRLGLLLTLSSCSAGFFCMGVQYVYYVWTKNEDPSWRHPEMMKLSFSVWMVFILFIHLVLWQKTRLQIKNSPHQPGMLGTIRKNEGMFKDRMFTSMIMELSGDQMDDDSIDGNESMGSTCSVKKDSVAVKDDGIGLIVPVSTPCAVDPIPNKTEDDLETGTETKASMKSNDTTMMIDEPSFLRLMLSGQSQNRTRVELGLFLFKWILIGVMASFFCLFVIINVGAQAQKKSTKEKIGAVTDLLYTGMDYQEVCAFDNRGAESAIMTFANKEAAHAADFLVLHCGACGACSTWHNLEKEWSTRSYLAEASQTCAQKSLFGGGDEAVDECLMSEPIDFDGQCVECWREDILCTKKHCSFIFMQSFIVNGITDFQVGPNSITTATCEEAHCEVGQFVPCSGATRRRMNIQSSIARPKEQQCNIVDVSWEDLFGSCCSLADFE